MHEHGGGGRRARGRPRKTWEEVTKNDLRVKGLNRETEDRIRWRTAIR